RVQQGPIAGAQRRGEVEQGRQREAAALELGVRHGQPRAREGRPEAVEQVEVEGAGAPALLARAVAAVGPLDLLEALEQGLWLPLVAEEQRGVVKVGLRGADRGGAVEARAAAEAQPRAAPERGLSREEGGRRIAEVAAHADDVVHGPSLTGGARRL